MSAQNDTTDPLPAEASKGRELRIVMQQVRALRREKQALIRELDHRVKNSLQVVSSLLHHESEQVQDPQARRALLDSQRRIQAMALVHERLYGSHSLAQVDFPAYVRDLTSCLLGPSRPTPPTVTLTTAVEDIPLGADVAIPCGLIISELVANALERAFPPGRKGKIHVAFHSGDGHCTLAVSDDGVGWPPHLELPHPNTLGLRLLRMFAEQLGGALEVDRREGTTFTVTFPQP